MQEVIKNIFLEDSVVANQLPDHEEWLEDRDGMSVRFVGGIHNITDRDKSKWVREERKPMRFVESGTAREEVWFEENWRTPKYLSLDADGKLTSHQHLPYDKTRPSLVQNIKQENPVESADSFISEFQCWHCEDTLHREEYEGDELLPAIRTPKLIFPLGNDYISGIIFNDVREYWLEGEWKRTTVESMTIVFRKQILNSKFIQDFATDWIIKNCKHGFFPGSVDPFANAEEEFLFLTDICSKG